MDIKDEIKLIIAEILWKLPKSTSNNIEVKKYKDQLINDGFCVINDFIDFDFIQG